MQYKTKFIYSPLLKLQKEWTSSPKQSLLFLHNTCDFFLMQKQCTELGNSLSASHHVMFVLVKLAFVALHSWTFWVDGSCPVFIFGAVNCLVLNISKYLQISLVLALNISRCSLEFFEFLL